MTLPHCTGCTEPGEPTHHGETVEHIHDWCNATIAALREALVELSEGKGRYSMDPLTHADNCIEDMKAIAVDALAQPIPPAAAKLLAERDAGRALYEAIMNGEGRVYLPAVEAAVEAYRKVVD